MKKIGKYISVVLAAAMITTMVSGCGGKAADSEEKAAKAPENTQEPSGEAEETESAGGAEEETTDYTTGTPWMDSNIDGNVTKDTEVNLKDDFYLAVNKDGILDLAYRPGSSNETAYGKNEPVVESNMMALITDESITGREAGQLRAYYHALDDWETREPMARALLQEHLDVIDGMKSMKDYYDAVHEWNSIHSLEQWGLFTLNWTIGLEDSTIYIGEAEGHSLTLEDAAEYKERTEVGETNYEKNKRIYEYGCELMGIDRETADQEFDRMIDFEARIAEHTLSQADMMGAAAVENMNNYTTIDELDQMLGDGYDLRAAMEDNGFVPEQIMIYMPDQFKFFGELLSDESNLEDLKNWMKVHCLIDSVPDMSKEAMIHTEEIKQEVTGTQDSKEYDKMLLSQVNKDLGIFMQQAYVKQYATPEMKEEITTLCEDIIAEYRTMLQEEDWLSQEMKDKAVEKLDDITINAVYPDKWEDYSGLDVTGMNYYDALQAIKTYKMQIACSNVNQKVDPEIWQFDFLEVNAGYNPSDNSINIFLGILGEETFTTDMSKEEVYGRIGAIIGHEISHAFDSTGGQFDKDGNMSDWWPEEDKKAFDEKVQKVRDFYDQIVIYGDKHLTGANLDGEATADIAGLQCLLRLARKDENFDYDTLFRSYAALWCSKQTPYAAEYLNNTDPHPSAYLRVNVALQQFDKFLETYDIQEGDGMYLAPKDRITVW